MRENRQSVDEIKLSIFISKLRGKCIALKLSEGQMLLTPFNQFGIIVRTIHLRSTQSFPLSDHAPNTTAEVKNSIQAFKLNVVPFEQVTDLTRRDFAAAQKDIGSPVICY